MLPPLKNVPRTPIALFTAFLVLLCLKSNGQEVRELARFTVEANHIVLSDMHVQHGKIALSGSFLGTWVVGDDTLTTIPFPPGGSPFILDTDTSFNDTWTQFNQVASSSTARSKVSQLSDGNLIQVIDLDSGSSYLGYTSNERSAFAFKIDRDSHSLIGTPVAGAGVFSGNVNDHWMLGSFDTPRTFGSTQLTPFGGTLNAALFHVDENFIELDAIGIGYPAVGTFAFPGLQLGNKVIGYGEASQGFSVNILGVAVENTSIYPQMVLYDFNLADPLGTIDVSYPDTGTIRGVQSVQDSLIGFFGSGYGKVLNWFGENMEDRERAGNCFILTDQNYAPKWGYFISDPTGGGGGGGISPMKKFCVSSLAQYGVLERAQTDFIIGDDSIAKGDIYFGVLNSEGVHASVMQIEVDFLKDAVVAVDGDRYYLALLYDRSLKFGDVTNPNTQRKDRLSIFEFSPGVLVGSIRPEKQFKVGIYPNPTEGELRLQGSSTQFLSANIFDLTGRELFSVQAPSESIDCTSLTPGMYLLSLRLAGGESKSFLFSKVGAAN